MNWQQVGKWITATSLALGAAAAFAQQAPLETYPQVPDRQLRILLHLRLRHVVLPQLAPDAPEEQGAAIHTDRRSAPSQPGDAACRRA
jgi:hypothetical protein